MITPQQIQEVSFERALFGGYDVDSVNEFFDLLTEDYVALYKENSVLKSKMRILVEKLEEYRKQESSMQSALLAAQKTSEQMLAETEKKCARLLHEAEETAQSKAQNTDQRLGAEQERLEVAKQATAQFLDGMGKEKELPKSAAPEPKPAETREAFDFDKNPTPPSTEEKADALIEQIGAQIEQAVPANAAETQPEHAAGTPKKFEGLKFGKNYKPGPKKTQK